MNLTNQPGLPGFSDCQHHDLRYTIHWRVFGAVFNNMKKGVIQWVR